MGQEVRAHGMNEPLCHCVREEDIDDLDSPYTKVRAVCGKEALLDPEGWPIPEDFDFVIAPDKNNLTDCWPCLEQMAGKRGIQEKAKAPT